MLIICSSTLKQMMDEWRDNWEIFHSGGQVLKVRDVVDVNLAALWGVQWQMHELRSILATQFQRWVHDIVSYYLTFGSHFPNLIF